MSPLKRSGSGWQLVALIFSLLAILNIAFAAPLQHNETNAIVLNTRTDAPIPLIPITEEEYIAYLKQYYPDTDKYIFYTNGALEQVHSFQLRNPGYFYYDNFFNSRAYFAHKKGATSKYKEQTKDTFYKTKELEVLQEGLSMPSPGDPRLHTINHMVKDATDPSQILATEDAKGVFTYRADFGPEDDNAGPPDDPIKGDTNSGSDSSASFRDPATQETTTGDTADPKDSGARSSTGAAEITDPAPKEPTVHL
nr:hypothetical protein B0A51_14386 [Rachicladosporium sp. CCFEE 5018]